MRTDIYKSRFIFLIFKEQIEDSQCGKIRNDHEPISNPYS